MPTLFITEFAQEGFDALGNVVQAVRQPPVAQQTVAIGGASAQSATLNGATTLVRLNTDVNCRVLFGGNPTAVAGSMRMPADSTEYFVVPVNSGLKVAVIEGA